VIRTIAILLMLSSVGCSTSKRVDAGLPMPGQTKHWKAFESHMKSCEICLAEDPKGGPGSICQTSFGLLIQAMESDSDLWVVSPRDGYRYAGPPIDGYLWSVKDQKWLKAGAI
jgi:hypothetical protein